MDEKYVRTMRLLADLVDEINKVCSSEDYAEEGGPVAAQLEELVAQRDECAEYLDSQAFV